MGLLPHLLNQAIAGGNAYLTGLSTGEQQRRGREAAEQERLEKRRTRMLQDALLGINADQAHHELEQDRGGEAARMAHYQSLPQDVRDRLGPYVPGTDYVKMIADERRVRDERDAEDDWIEAGGRRFPNTDEGARQAIDWEREISAAGRDPQRGSGGGSGGATGITAGVNREYDYWQQVAENYIAASNGDVTAALTAIHRNPLHRGARLSGALSDELLQSAASRYRSRGGAAVEGERMSWSQAEQTLREANTSAWDRLDAMGRRRAMERYRSGQDPFAVTRPSGPLSREEAEEAHRLMAGKTMYEAARELVEMDFSDAAIRQIWPGVSDRALRQARRRR
jgi:hypothetical protein